MEMIIALSLINIILTIVLIVIVCLKKQPLSDIEKKHLEWKTELHAFEHIKSLVETSPQTLPQFLNDMIRGSRLNLGLATQINIPKNNDAVRQTVSYLESRGFKVKSKDKGHV